jgi:hypothetical protein
MHHSRDTDRKQWNETNAPAMAVLDALVLTDNVSF